MPANSQEQVSSIISDEALKRIQETLDRDVREADKRKIQPRSPIPSQKEQDKIFEQQEGLTERLLGHLDNWLITEAALMGTRLNKCLGDKSKTLGLMGEFEIRRGTGLSMFLEWLDSTGANEEIKEAVMVETLIRAGTLWMINSTAKELEENQRYNPFDSGKGGAKIISLITLLTLTEVSEEGGGGYHTDPDKFWGQVERFVPRHIYYEGAYRLLSAGSKAETITGRVLKKLCDNLGVSTSKQDTEEGFDLIIYGNPELGIPATLVDVKTWGFLAVISHGADDPAGNYVLNGHPYTKLDPTSWQIPPNLIDSALKRKANVLVVRLPLGCDMTEFETYVRTSLERMRDHESSE